MVCPSLFAAAVAGPRVGSVQGLEVAVEPIELLFPRVVQSCSGFEFGELSVVSRALWSPLPWPIDRKCLQLLSAVHKKAICASSCVLVPHIFFRVEYNVILQIKIGPAELMVPVLLLYKLFRFNRANVAAT